MIARIRGALAALAAVAMAIFSAWILGRRSGASDAKADMLQKDQDNADAIRARADRARADFNADDPIDWLRAGGHLRD